MTTPDQLGIHKMLPLHWLFSGAKFIYDHNWKVLAPLVILVLFIGIHRGLSKKTIIFSNYWDLAISTVCWISLIPAARPNVVAGLLDGTIIFNIRFTGPQVIIYFIHTPLFLYASWLSVKNNKGLLNICLSIFTKHIVLLLFVLFIIGSSRGKRNDESDEAYAVYQLQAKAAIVAWFFTLTRLVANRTETKQTQLESIALKTNKLAADTDHKNISNFLKLRVRS
jgi:hypothetical protein